MPRIVYYVASSLDGYIAPADGSLDWLSAHESGGEDYGYAELYASVDAVLVGRRTYEQFLTFPDWPYAGRPCWVFSKRPVKAASPEVTVTADTPERAVSVLDALGLRRVWLVGGGQLAGAFRAAGLITEYIVTVLPVVLGAGTPLFAAPGPREDLRLVDSKKYVGGLVQLCYRRQPERPRR